jgi:hypothetical protein
MLWLRTKQIPALYRRIIDPLIATARVFLEDGHSLDPVAIVGNSSTDQGVTVTIAFGDDEAKARSARAIQTAAYEINADFILTIMEAWVLPKDMVDRHQEILDRYGAIAKSPYKIDAVSFTLEIRRGIWATQLPIMPKDPLNKTRTFGKVTLKFVDSAQRVGRLLPVSGNAPSGGSSLH